MAKSRVSRSISPLPALTLQLNVPNGTDSLIVLKGDTPWKLRSMAVSMPAVTSMVMVPLKVWKMPPP